MPDLDDFGGNGWGGLSSTRPKTSTKKGTLSRTTTNTSKTSKSDDTKAKFKDLKEDKVDTASPEDDKSGAKKEVIQEESAAKAVKNMWASFGTSTSSRLGPCGCGYWRSHRGSRYGWGASSSVQW